MRFLATTLVLLFLGTHGCIEDPEEPSLGDPVSEDVVFDKLVEALGTADPASVKVNDKALYQFNLRYSNSSVIALSSNYLAVQENNVVNDKNLVALYTEYYEYDPNNQSSKPVLIRTNKECLHFPEPGPNPTEQCQFEKENFGSSSVSASALQKSLEVDPLALKNFIQQNTNQVSTQNADEEVVPIRTRFYQLRTKTLELANLGGITAKEVTVVTVQDFSDGSQVKQELQISFSYDVPSILVPTPLGNLWNVVSYCQRRIENLSGTDYYVSQCYALQDFAKVK